MRYILSRQQIRERLGPILEEDTRRTSGLRVVVKKLSMYFESSSLAKRKERLLVQAGVPFTGAEFVVISLGLAISCALLLGALSRGKLLLCVVGAIAGFYSPTLFVQQRVRKKQELLNEQLPIALSLMANSLRSGYSYIQAMDLVSKEMPYPIGEEFGILVKEMNLGISTEDSFMNLVKRVNTDDLDLMVTAFLIQRQVGGNLAELLDKIAQTLRERISMKRKIGTLTAQGKLSGVVLCLMPIVLAAIMHLLNPNYLASFISHPLGKLMLGFGLALMVIGIVWMRKIVDIEV